ncbi:MAG: peptide-methionine (S)-S-oxide reductase MsrA [Nitriliruptoraceae bacterium]
MVTAEQALPGRDTPLEVAATHHVTGRPIVPPWPQGHELIALGMGCFWGAERLYWSLSGVHTTFVGYAGGVTPNPTYREVCTGRTGHAEVAAVVFDPATVTVDELLRPFWENHDPTQVDRQGNDIGTQYRSLILTTTDQQREAALASREHYQQRLSEHGYGTVVTAVEPLDALYWAETEHQQYLAKHPSGYCNHGFCQVAY